MRVLLSTSFASPSAVHGGPIVARRHAEALLARGVEVCIAAPDVAQPFHGGGITTQGYDAPMPSSPHFAAWRPNAAATLGLRKLIDRYEPDIVYDVHGPAWAIEAAVGARRPVVSMIGDYNWFCRRSFLMDSSLERCSGPESLEKCFTCINGEHRRRRRVVQSVLQQAEIMGVPPSWTSWPRLDPYRVWTSIEESNDYTRGLRDQVDRFVVGDAHAETFFRQYGIPSHKLVRVSQCLPEDALVARVREDHGRPAVERPLRIGFVGRPHLDKGIHVLAKAFESLPQSIPVELWIVHSQMATAELLEPHFHDAAQFRAQLACGRIRLFRPADNEALFQLMADVDVGVVPSLVYESPSLAMLEFVAQRTPIVRSESEGMNHVIQDRINGRTFPYGDWKALRAILLEIAGDPDLLDRWRSRLPAIGKDSDYARELVAVFTELITEPEPQRSRRQYPAFPSTG